ncbi:hypothetical protein [Bythopirellula polymerisocia]|nr:hypothetical protein [Bythopirellula polymerisocia]
MHHSCKPRYFALCRRTLTMGCLLASMPNILLHAADIVSLLPPNTLGYAVVRNIASSDQKVARLTTLFNPGVPTPLGLAKAITGIPEGIDLEGDAVFAYLANSNSPANPTPLVLLPVSNYQAFAASIQGDATGEICRVTIADVDLLVAKLGDFSLVMNVEHRDLMRQVLATNNEASANSFSDWMAGNDVSLVLTRLGMAHIARHGWFQESIESEDGFAEDEFGEIAVSNGLTQQEALPLADFARRNFRAVGLGLVIDKADNSRLRWKAEFLKPSDSLEQRPGSIQEQLSGLVARPFAVAGGGALPPRASDIIADYMTILSLQEAEQQGKTDFTREDWAAERRSWDLTLEGVREVTLLMVPPTTGEPLLATFFARITVDDSAKYLASLKESFELANELTSRSKSPIKMLYEFTPQKIGDFEGVAITTDLDKATGDQNVDVWQAMLTASLGKEHKFNIFCSPVDKEHVFVGLQSSDKLLDFIEGFSKGETGLANEVSVQKTISLLDTESPHALLVDPQGIVEIARAWMKSFLVFGMVPELPLYPTVPPIAVTLSGDQLGWQGEVTLPLETLQSMATFVADLKKVFGQ